MQPLLQLVMIKWRLCVRRFNPCGRESGGSLPAAAEEGEGQTGGVCEEHEPCLPLLHRQTAGEFASGGHRLITQTMVTVTLTMVAELMGTFSDSYLFKSL